MNFSDAVVAIAITLLVLPLVDIPGELRSSSVSAMFVEYQWSFFGFSLSLSVIARFWQAHHQLFEYLGDYSSRLLWVKTVWLLSIVALPFSTALLASRADGDDARAVKGVYLGTIVATSAVLAWMLLIIQRFPERRADRAARLSAATGHGRGCRQ